ncbi:hypothetical protein FRC16_000685 [Serendipita sp. 398]|nr:hypothetical protein FRC16_000685 [Serendipita sp. 398]
MEAGQILIPPIDSSKQVPLSLDMKWSIKNRFSNLFQKRKHASDVMLQDSPHIGKIVKTLIFPARYGHACPHELLDAFQGITNRIESLSELNTTLRLVEEESSTGNGKG